MFQGGAVMTEVPMVGPVRMLAIDIDGTLLNPDGKISVTTLGAVPAAQQAGLAVKVAAERRYCNTKQIADELGLNIPLILYDGAMIVEHPQGTILHRQTLAADIAQEAVDVLVRHGVQPVVHPNTGLDEQIWTGPAEFDHLWL